MVAPARGEIWWMDFDPIRGHEQAGKRPALIVSTNSFNRGPRELVWAIPLTRTGRRYRFHVPVSPTESGLPAVSHIMCEQLRSVSIDRLLDNQPVGRVSRATMREVTEVLRVLLDIF